MGEEDGILLTGSITKLPEGAAGQVVVAGSHGGAYPGRLAIAASLRAVILNDAGVGLDRAGIAGLALCETVGLAAATVAAASCRIGDPADMMARGIVSYVNLQAEACGVAPGDPVADAARKLRAAKPMDMRAKLPEAAETRSVERLPGAARDLVLVDSASLVRPEDAGAVVVTGSHGGLFDPDPARALAADAFAAIFNDAGRGADDWSVSRLPVLDRRGIAAATVSTGTARIGEARSTWQDGVISEVNERARAAGVSVGQACRDAVARLVSAGPTP